MQARACSMRKVLRQIIWIAKPLIKSLKQLECFLDEVGLLQKHCRRWSPLWRISITHEAAADVLPRASSQVYVFRKQ